MKLPSAIVRYICDYAVRTRRGAFLKVAADGELLEVGGSLSTYGLDGLKPGVEVTSCVDFLHGMLPLEGDPDLLLAIEVAEGVYAEAHLIPDGEADWVILFDSSEETAIDQLLQQRSYEASLLREELDRERRAHEEVGKAKAGLAVERRKARHFLSNLLPDAVIDRLHRGEQSVADDFEDAAFLHIAVHAPDELTIGMQPIDRARLFGEILTVVTKLVREHQGGIVKTAGPALLAAFGVPTPLEGPLIRSVRAAAQIRARFERVTAGTEERPIQLQMAIAVGPATGAIVGMDRFAYEVWGPPVGEVSRLVRLAGPGEVLLAEGATRRLEGRAPIEVGRDGVGRLGEFDLSP